MPIPDRATATLLPPHGVCPGGVRIALYSGPSYDGHALLDEDAARILRDQLNDALTALHARAMYDRWPKEVA